MNYSPANDGIDHVNVYSKGRTELGRFLSNFAHTPVVTEDGPFASIEGYWYWLGCSHPNKDFLRTRHGFAAKAAGRDLGGRDWNDSETFKRKIKSAILIKLWNNKKFSDQLVNNTLVLTHYYVYGGRVINVPEAEWILDAIRSFKDGVSY
jgi:hypothetical protein